MRSRANAATGRRAAALHGTVLLLVLALEATVFLVGTARHYAWVYPRRFDQAQYLEEAYQVYNDHRANGWLDTMRASFLDRSPQGLLHRPLAVLAFLLAGPSRMAALSLNIWAFIVLQGYTFVVIRRRQAGWSLPWIAVGLLAGVAIPWTGGAGSAMDFRLDWLAACAYGVALAAAWDTDGFRSTAGSLRFGGAVAVVLLIRFLTGAYLAVVFVALALMVVAQPARRRRVTNLCLSGITAVSLAGWAFWRCRDLIQNYYVVNHFTGLERNIRDSHIDGMASVRWLLDHLWQDVGAMVLLGAAGMIGLGIATKMGRSNRVASGLLGPESALVPAIFLVAPVLVLFFQPEKAPQVMSITIPGVAGLLLVGWACLEKQAPAPARQYLTIGVVVIGLVSFSAHTGMRPAAMEEETAYRTINALSDFLFYRAEEAGLAAPRVAVTATAEALNAGVFWINGFERHHRVIPFVATLPGGLFRLSAVQIGSALGTSDFVCLVDQPEHLYPIDEQLAGMAAEHRRWCDAHLRFDGSAVAGSIRVSVFERPELARPPTGGVVLHGLLRAALADSDPVTVSLPAAAQLRPLQPVLWSAATPLDYPLPGVYSPMSYEAATLPSGFSLDRATGLLRGRFAGPGRYVWPIRVTNARGSSSGTIVFDVGQENFAAGIEVVGGPGLRDFTIKYRAYAADATLDHIDLADFTTMTITRLVPASAEKRAWQGVHAIHLADSRPHQLQMRFVRYVEGLADPYPYLDRPFALPAADAGH